MTDAVDPIRALQSHLEQWVHAYGADLAIPKGTVLERPTAAATQVPVAADPTALAQPATAPPAEAPPAEAPPAEAPPAEAPPQHLDPKQNNTQQTVTSLRAIRAEVQDCTKCKLHAGRQKAVFGEGAPNARVMFIGEAPGAREDQTGRPFVGEAGQLLDRILKNAMGLERAEVFIANVNKCRPPANRTPEADEVAACLPYLHRQIEIVQPEVLVCLGRTAAQNLLGSTESTTKLRQKQHEHQGIPVIVTWHPAYLLREPSRKREAWEDIKRVNHLLGLPEDPSAST